MAKKLRKATIPTIIPTNAPTLMEFLISGELIEEDTSYFDRK